jgi:hypothetical protein
MSKKIPDQKLLEVHDLVRGGDPVWGACRRVGISNSSYYRHKSRIAGSLAKLPRPDFSELGESFDCALFQSLLDQGRQDTVRALRRKIPAIFKTYASKPQPIHPRTLLKQINDIQKSIEHLGRSFAELSESGVHFIARMEPRDKAGWNYANLIQVVLGFNDDLQVGEDFQILVRCATDSPKGGRPANFRLKAAVVGLANLYVGATKLNPTHTYDVYQNSSSSDFNEFSKQAFSHFLQDEFNSWAALDKNIKDHVPVIDYGSFQGDKINSRKN